VVHGSLPGRAMSGSPRNHQAAGPGRRPAGFLASPHSAATPHTRRRYSCCRPGVPTSMFRANRAALFGDVLSGSRMKSWITSLPCGTKPLTAATQQVGVLLRAQHVADRGHQDQVVPAPKGSVRRSPAARLDAPLQPSRVMWLACDLAHRRQVEDFGFRSAAARANAIE